MPVIPVMFPAVWVQVSVAVEVASEVSMDMFMEREAALASEVTLCTPEWLPSPVEVLA